MNRTNSPRSRVVATTLPTQPAQPMRVLLIAAAALAVGTFGGIGLRNAVRALLDDGTPSAAATQLLEESAPASAPSMRLSLPAPRAEQLPSSARRAGFEGEQADSNPFRATALSYGVEPRPAVDLEYNTEFAEPSQDKVLASPPAWRPDPRAESNPKPVVESLSAERIPAAGGQQLTIRGHGLQAKQVMIGLAPARIISASADAVTVLVPAGPVGPAAVVITNADGNFAIASGSLEYAN